MTDESEVQLQLDQIADEFLSRRRAGESPTIEEYQAKHPALAGEIEQSLKTILFVDNLNDDDSHVPTNSYPEIGDYQIVGKIGQGGMGIVYEANQESLERRVALKVLPQHLSDDPKFVERFKREARAAAKLHHTNIVPVFEVGQTDQTLYYAMQYIDGLSLDEVQQEIVRIRQDGLASSHSSVSSLINGSDNSNNSGGNHLRTYFKSIAKLAASAADALDYAHQRAVVHRDVKPANLILDTKGVVWLTDFGLAKTTDSQITETGDFLGTARYMSPERFKGDGDHRVDIYGLGVTLYEMATFRRPHDAANRIQLIEQISSTEPKRPSEINRSIPLDLETIILRSIEKDPRRRYSSAAELAADLTRFVDDQPIHARRASVFERTLRWTQRNKALTAAIASMIATIGILVVSFYTILNQRNFAQQQSKRADENAERANIEADAARQAVQSLLTEVGDEQLRNIPMMDDLRRKLLEDALLLNQQFLARSSSLDDRDKLIEAHTSVADIYGRLGRFNEGIEELEVAKKILRTGTGKNQGETDVLLSRIELVMLPQLLEVNRLEEARLIADDVIGRVLSRMEKHPDPSELVNDFALAYQASANALNLSGDKNAAVAKLREAIEVFQTWEVVGIDPRARNSEAITRLLLGNLLRQMGQSQQAGQQFKLTQELFVDLINEFPNERIYQNGLAQSSSHLATFYLSSGRLADAKSAFELGIKQSRKLARQFPQNLDYRRTVANLLSGLATALAIAGESDIALEKFIESANEFEQVILDFPDAPSAKHLASQAFRRVGVHYKNTGRPGEAARPYQRAYKILESLTKEFPTQLHYKLDFAEMAYSNATLPTMKENEKEQGLEYSKKAVEIGEYVVNKNPRDVRARHKLSKYYTNLAEYYWLNNELEPVEGLYRKAIERQQELVAEVPQYEEHHRMLGVSLYKCSSFFFDQDRLDDALETIGKTVLLRRESTTNFPQRWDHPMELVSALLLQGDILAAQEQAERAADSYLEAETVCRQSFETHPNIRDFRIKAMSAYESLLNLPSLPATQSRLAILSRAKELADENVESKQPDERLIEIWQRIKQLKD